MKKVGVFVFTALLISACSKKGATLTYPLVLPPVKAATPTGLGGGTLLSQDLKAPLQPLSLDLADFKSRFFSAGPTYIFSILQGVDDRISGYNERGSGVACTTQTPVKYTITPYGQSVDMYAQCYETLTASYTGDPAFIQWGQTSDGNFYLWSAFAAGWTAAIATPITGTTNHTVQIWTTVGQGNSTCGAGTWDGCSYTVMQITANQSTKSFEMTVAGSGVGYCGAQIASDGTNVYGKGSSDMGTTCNTTSDICVTAADVTATATCTTAQKTFALTPLGRKSGTGTSQSFGASDYPGGTGNTITLNGTSSDSLYFGPTTPTSGVGLFK